MNTSNSPTSLKILSNIEISDIDGDFRVNIPFLYCGKNWPFSSQSTPKSIDIIQAGWTDCPFKFIDSEIEMIIGMNHPDLLKPLELIEGPTKELFVTRHHLGFAI